MARKIMMFLAGLDELYPTILDQDGRILGQDGTSGVEPAERCDNF